MIDFTKSKQYTLSIRLCTDGFSFSIYNPVYDDRLSVIEKKIIPSSSLTANLKEWFRQEERLSHSYKRVNFMVADKRFMVVPSELFREKDAELLFHHNYPQKENETILYNPLPKNNTVVVFGIDQSACSFLKEHFPNARFYSQATPMIDYFSTKSKLGNSKKMYAAFRKEGIDLYCFERGQLLLCNSFECTHTEDYVYYLLYAWKELNFNQERDELHLTGTLTHKEVLMEKLHKFISQVFITNPATNLDMQALLTCE